MNRNLLILVFLILVVFDTTGTNRTKKWESVSDYYTKNDSLTTIFYKNTVVSTLTLKINSNNQFFMEIQHGGPFEFAFGEIENINGSPKLIFDKPETARKINEYKVKHKKSRWNYVPITRFKDLSFVFEDGRVTINQNEDVIVLEEIR